MKQPYESDEQKAVVNWLTKRGYFVFHIPNHQEMRKDMGAISGMPDLQVVMECGFVVWIEMKRRKGGVLRDDQKIVHKELKDRGHYVVTAKGAKEAIEGFKEMIGQS